MCSQQKEKKMKNKTGLFSLNLALLIAVILSITPAKSEAETNRDPLHLAEFIVTSMYRQNKKCAKKVSKICSEFLDPKDSKLSRHIVDCFIEEIQKTCNSSFKSAREIHRQYRNNEKAATKRYLGKPVLIQGTVLGNNGIDLLLDATTYNNKEPRGVFVKVTDKNSVSKSVGEEDDIWLSCIGYFPALFNSKYITPRFEECNIVYWEKAR